MFKIAFHPDYVLALPERHRFPMIKYELIFRQLVHQGIADLPDFFEPKLISDDLVLLAHDPDYWQKLKDMRLSHSEVQRIGFPLSSALITRERRIAQGTVDGALLAMSEGVSFNIAGGTHHAGSDWGEGFCLLNDQGIAASFLLESGKCSKILIIDVDVHQGNGTAQMFKHNKRVFTFSIHGQNNFPFAKEVSDWDIGLQDNTSDDDYLRLLGEALKQLFDQEKPDFVFYLAGVDVLPSDKLGRLSVSVSGCKQRDQMIFEYCKRLDIPIQICMGGGYSVNLGEIVDAHCNTFKQAVEVFC